MEDNPAANRWTAVRERLRPSELLARSRLRLSGHTLVLFGILAAGVTLRLWGLNALGFNSDEAVYAGQGAAIARNPLYSPLFPVFRAHPLLFQFALSVLFRFGVIDWAGRLLAAAFGAGTILAGYRTGKTLYGTRAGLYTALFLALMPYHIIGSRQVLLDGPMTLFAVLGLYFAARFIQEQNPFWLYSLAAALGLAVITKETAVLLLVSIYFVFFLVPEVRVRFRHLLGSGVVFLLTITPYPLSILLARGGGSGNADSYLVWQFFRLPNHTADFYAGYVLPDMGLLLLFAAAAGLLFLFRKRSWRETLLLSWILVPLIFFQFWPTKGYLYLLPIAPPIAILAARFVAGWFPSRPIRIAGLFLGSPVGWAGFLISLSLLAALIPVFFTPEGGRYLAGSGGVPGGREAGEWVRENTPPGTRLMTIGPSMANILQFYGFRPALGISVSPNPLYRNPSYEPILNPDLQIRRGEIQYIVWDVYSASRSNFFSEKLLEYVQKYNGRVVHLETGGEGSIGEPVIIIYEVQP